MFTLYHAHHSTCSQKVRLTLAEKGLEYESKLVDLANKGQLDPDYLKLNPNGVVPTLLHDGKPVIDSSVICEYLDEVCPQPPLLGADALARARVPGLDALSRRGADLCGAGAELQPRLPQPLRRADQR